MGTLWTVAIASIGIGVAGSALGPGGSPGAFAAPGAGAPSVARAAEGTELEERRDQAEVHRLAAAGALEEGDPEAATRAALQALALDAEEAASWELLGDLRFRQERFEEARAAYERAAELDGHRFRTWLQLGRTLRELERPEEAQAAISRARELQPDHPDAAAVAAALAEGRGDLRQASDLYESAARRTRGRKRASLLTRLAAVRERDGDRAAAAAALLAAAEADDTSAARWGRAAAALRATGAEEDARRAQERAAALEASTAG